MKKAVDTETTGIHLRHGDMPFYVSVAQEDAQTFSWVWPVDPKTRRVMYWAGEYPTESEIDYIFRLYWLLVDDDAEWLMHNAKFDTRALWLIITTLFEKIRCTSHKFDPYRFLERCGDTLLKSHAIENSGSHGLKDLALKHLDISDADETNLKLGVNQCRDYARRLGWAIASPEACPVQKRAPKSGWWVMDMWLPAAVAADIERRGYDRLSAMFTTADLKLLLPTYGDMDSVRTLCLDEPYTAALKEMGLTAIYNEQQMLLPVTYRMEENGVTVHHDLLIEQNNKAAELAVEHAKKAGIACGNPGLNVASPDQMQRAVYETFNRPVVHTTNTGTPSVDQTVLEDMISDTAEDPFSAAHTFAFHASCAKRCNTAHTYLSGYLRAARKRSDVSMFYTLHPNFNITGTDTTRLSSSNPNGQNIGKGKDPFVAGIYDPLIANLMIKREYEQLNAYEQQSLAAYQWYLDTYSTLGLSLRKMFGPRPGREWWAVDYVQLQLVIFAYVSGEKSMIKAVEDGMDFHDFMARMIFKIPPGREVDEGQRRIAKNVNFGFVFGAGPAKIEATAKMPGLYAEVSKLFPAATKFIEINSKQARREGCVYAAGYRLSVPKDKPYAATNYIIQGWEGRIVKRAMIYCDAHLTQTIPEADMFITLNVHDELVFDAPVGTGQYHIGNLCNFMELAGTELAVPCKVDMKRIDKHWNVGEKYALTAAAAI